MVRVKIWIIILQSVFILILSKILTGIRLWMLIFIKNIEIEHRIFIR